MPTRYSKLTIFLHWLVAAAMIAAFILGQTMENLPRGPERAPVLAWHLLIGLAVVVLLLPRIMARAKGPRIPEEGPALSRIASRLVHLLLYASMLVLPVLGILAIATGSRTVDVLGLFSIQPLWPSELVHETSEDIHGVVAKVFLVTLVLHILATIWHAVVLRDGVAGRMLPFLARSRR